MADIELIIAVKAAEIYVNDMNGRLTREAAIKKAQREVQKELNKICGIEEIIEDIRGDDND